MARISYYDIEVGLGEWLTEQVQGVTIKIEDELFISNEDQPIIGIYLDRREMAPNQYIRRRVDYHFIITLWCWCFSMEGPREAARLRDDLVSRVEEVLLGDRQFGMGDMVETSWIEGGELPTGRVPDTSGFASGGEIRMVVKVNETSTEG